ncbi:hypothetical protein FQA39_LY02604 [Lamprigera yunnana]|nr:hypothetical protein FQA39_LY02604 [Lamprigera yunnana]
MSKSVNIFTAKSNKKEVVQHQKTPFKSILSKKQTGGINVTYEGEDVTPEPLNSLLNEGCNLMKVDSALKKTDSKTTTSDTKIFIQSTSRFHTELHKQQVYAETIFLQSYRASLIDEVFIDPECKISLSITSADKKDDEAIPEVFEYRTSYSKMPSRISLLLKETNTIYIFELPSQTVNKNSEEATAVETENARYEFLTEGKGRNRKVTEAEAQTIQTLQKTRSTEAHATLCKQNMAFASIWDMYDVYEKVEVPFVSDKCVKEKAAIEEDEIFAKDLEFSNLLKNLDFQQALCVIERLLANNNYNKEQKRFRGLTKLDSQEEEITYKYTLQFLWTFVSKDTIGKCVTAMCWNEDNTDILAVGYGKFYYTERATGMVMLWNIKNPVQPERTYRFPQPVTTLNFSQKNPNLLGIGFYDGNVKVVDVSLIDCYLIGTSGEDSPSFEPIWRIIWYKGTDYFKDTEQIITSCQDGRISYYRNQDTIDLMYEQIMRISRPEGKVKGIETLRQCHIPGIPVNRYAAALVICQHPVDGNIYLVGTNEGTIHRCSRNYHHQHLDLFLAHYGPLYEIKFSPFCNKIFLTCGEDWCIRIWADGITEPLFELIKEMQSIQSVDWSPTHPTIIAHVSGCNIYIWDIQRKIYHPQSITLNPTSCRNTVILFAKNGRSIVVGDVEGNVHVMALNDLPFIPFFSDDLLTNAIFRCLNTRPDLTKKLKKMGKLNSVHENLQNDL